ncbi:MAG: hypothetical protein K9G33_16095 [Sneathiella sp.]|nr:hypothetical protein [Sneathiella sp.]
MLITEDEKLMTRFAKVGASSIFVFLAVLLIFSRVPIGDIFPPALYVGFAAFTVLLIFYIVDNFKTSFIALISIGGFFVILLTWAYATSSFYDAGHDSYAYHLRAVWDLAAGWSPFLTANNNIWVDSYPSGYWVLQSYLVSITGLLLSGHSMIIGLMAAVALLAYGLFLEQAAQLLPRYHHLAALLFAVIVVGNPVVITQIMTHYTDAPLYLFGCALVFFLMSDALSANRIARWGAVSCIILLVNTKTACLYYVPLIVFGGFILELVLQGAVPGFFQRVFLWIKSKGILYGLAIVFAVLVIGYKPYVTNVLDHGKLLYPSVEKIMGPNTPANVETLPIPMKFLYGIFAKTEDNHWPIPLEAPVNLKIPGTFKLSEFKELVFDTRRGGFGPFFSLALLASIFAYAGCKLASRSNTACSWRRDGDGTAAFAVVLLGASMFFPESWWARYVPLTWLSAILFAMSSLYLDGKGKALIPIRLLQGLALIAFLLCIAAATLGAGRQNLYTYNRAKEISFMKQFPVVELSIWKPGKVIQSSSLSIWVELLKRQGVNTLVIPDSQKPSCENPGYLVGGVHWCTLGEQKN